jgi:hypothetical protein
MYVCMYVCMYVSMYVCRGVSAQLALALLFVAVCVASAVGGSVANQLSQFLQHATCQFALAPFDCIHVGFAIPYAERESILAGLGACLSPGGRMVAAVVDEDGKQHLCLMQHGK